MNESDSAHEGVNGERDTTAVNRAASIQSRVSSILAVGLMSFLGLGMLTWYYANAITRQSRARQGAQIQATNRAQGEMALPSLGRIDPPPPELPSSPVLWNPTNLPEIPLAVSTDSGTAVSGGAPPIKTAEQLAMERPIIGDGVFDTECGFERGNCNKQATSAVRRPGIG
jgi:type IV secretion system protein VirB10